MNDRKSKPRAAKDIKGKQAVTYTEGENEDTPALDKTQTKKPAPLVLAKVDEQQHIKTSLVPPTPESKINAIVEYSRDLINEYPENTLKRKEMEELYLPIMEHKFKTLKMLVDAAGPQHSVGTPQGREYTFRISKLSNAINCDTNTVIDAKETVYAPFE